MLVQIRSESRLRRWHCIFCSALFKGWSTCYPSPTQPPTPNPQPPTHTHSIIKPVLQPHRKQSLLYVTGRSLILAEVNKCTSMEGIFHRQAADNGAIVASSGSTSSAFSQDLVVGSGSTVPVRAYVSSPRWMCYAAETMWNMEHNQWGSCLFFFFHSRKPFFSIIERGLIAFSHFEKFARVALSPNTRTSLAAPPYFHEFLCSTVNGAFAIRELASHPSNPLGFH